MIISIYYIYIRTYVINIIYTLQLLFTMKLNRWVVAYVRRYQYTNRVYMGFI